MKVTGLILLILLIPLALAIVGCSRTDSLIRKLGGQDRVSADKAAEELEKMGPAAVESLIRLLGDSRSSPEARSRAAKVLGDIGDQRAVPALITALSDPAVAKSAGKALMTIGEPAVNQLLEATQSDRFDIQLAVIPLLGEMKEKKAVEPLCEVYLDKAYSAKAREASKAALIKICSGKLPTRILSDDLLSSPDPEVRAIAALELVRRREAKILRQAMDAFGKSKDRLAVMTLGRWYWRESSPEYRGEIIKCLEKIGNKTAEPICLECLQQCSEVGMADKWLGSGSPILVTPAMKWIKDSAGSLDAGTVGLWLGCGSPLILSTAKNWVSRSLDPISAGEWLNGESIVLKKAASAWVDEKSSHMDAATAAAWLDSGSPQLKAKAEKWVKSVRLDFNSAYTWAMSSNPTLITAAREYLMTIEIDRATAEKWLNSSSPALKEVARAWGEKHGLKVTEKNKNGRSR